MKRTRTMMQAPAPAPDTTQAGGLRPDAGPPSEAAEWAVLALHEVGDAGGPPPGAGEAPAGADEKESSEPAPAAPFAEVSKSRDGRRSPVWPIALLALMLLALLLWVLLG
jgi:hypothetical protein